MKTKFNAARFFGGTALAINFALNVSIASAASAKPIKEVKEPVGNFPADQYVKVATIAFSPPMDAPVDVPQAEINRYKKSVGDALEQEIREASQNGAKLVVTPEFSLIGYPNIPELPPEEDEFQNVGQILPYAEPLNGPSAKRFGALAKELGINLIIGIAEKGAGADEVYNTLLVLDTQGRIVTSYRKINLFEAESHFLKAGTQRVFWDSPWGRIGLFTCYDIHFPNPAGDLVTVDKVKAIIFPTSWVGENGMQTFQQFARRYNVFFMAANHTYFPDSGVIEAGGKIQSHIRQSSGPAYGYMKIK